MRTSAGGGGVVKPEGGRGITVAPGGDSATAEVGCATEGAGVADGAGVATCCGLALSAVEGRLPGAVAGGRGGGDESAERRPLNSTAVRTTSKTIARVPAPASEQIITTCDLDVER